MMNHILEIQEITKIFGAQIILENSSLNLNLNQVIWIAGENGIGKSTLLKCIAGIEPIQSGRINFSLHKISLLTEKDWLYPQLTVKENLEFWAKINDSKISLELIEIFSLNQILNKQIFTISQGMRKKVALTRVLQNNASILLLDEPYTFLDEKNVVILNEYLKKYKHDKLILIATHDKLNISSVVDHKYQIKNKKIEFEF